MQIVKNILSISKRLHISDQQLCKIIGSKSSSKISDWKRGKSRPYAEEVAAIAEYTGCPSDALLGIGVFQNWDEIIDNLDSVFNELRRTIPSDMLSDDGKTYLLAYLDIKMFYHFDEIGLMQWFSQFVRYVRITGCDLPPESKQYMCDVEITFTPEFDIKVQALHDAKERKVHKEREQQYSRLLDLRDGFEAQCVLKGNEKKTLRLTKKEANDAYRLLSLDDIDYYLSFLPKYWALQDSKLSQDEKPPLTIAARGGKVVTPEHPVDVDALDKALSELETTDNL